MWDTFLPDLLLTLIGSALTVAIAAGTFLVNRRYRENQALNVLIQEIHYRRAFTRIETLMEIQNAELSDDFSRVNASVSSIRDAIREARSLTRPVGKLQVPLSQMTVACNRYLELAARRPNRYWYFLEELRNDVHTQVERLAGASRRIHALEPGSGAL